MQQQLTMLHNRIKTLEAGDFAAAAAQAGALNFAANPSNVNHGKFWTVDTEYAECYWEAWVKPVLGGFTGYFISDGAGGQHNVLLGVNTNSTHATFTGNIFDGGDIISMDAVGDPVPLGDWVHLAFAYDGTNLRLFINGVCSFTLPFTGVRKYLAGGSDGNLYVGGSFHNNFPGLVKAVRGVEGGNAGIVSENRFIPRDFSGFISDGVTLTRASFVCDYSVAGTRLFIDAGEGFESKMHHGAFSRFDNLTPYPTWEAGEAGASNVIPTAPSTPSNALIFDSFSRINNLALFDATASLGSTEAGSLGVKSWTHAAGGAGVLYGRAVLYASQALTARVATDRRDCSIRVTRPGTPFHTTGILAAYKDANNFYKIFGHDTQISFEFMEAGVQTFPTAISVTGEWTELRVDVNGTDLEVFRDGVSVGNKTVIDDPLAVNHGIATDSALFRGDNFTIMAVS